VHRARNILACDDVVARDPATPDEYRERLPKGRGLAHVSIEVQRHADEAQERLLYEH